MKKPCSTNLICGALASYATLTVGDYQHSEYEQGVESGNLNNITNDIATPSLLAPTVSNCLNLLMRDKTRVIQSSAFRRLGFKTQVFTNMQGDLFRTRLTHSLEVANIGRIVANALALNAELVEVICLAHDLGHTPFGHVGQSILNKCLLESNHTGFEHNLHSLRIVDKLEQYSTSFDGLNLSFAVREGILKHCSISNAKTLGKVGQRFIAKTSPSLEAQLANVVDELAYSLHDIDDGLRAGILNVWQLAEEIPFIAHHLNRVNRVNGSANNVGANSAKERVLHKQLVHSLATDMVNDLISASFNNIRNSAVETLADVKQQQMPLIGYSGEMATIIRQIKRFLQHHLYSHRCILQSCFKAHAVIAGLFAAYVKEINLLPDSYKKRIHDGVDSHIQIVADYIAGMTDRYILKEYQSLLGMSSKLS